jgi:ribosomal protein S17
MSPFEALKGKKPRCIWEFGKIEPNKSFASYVDQLKENQLKINKYLHEKNLKAKEAQKKYHQVNDHLSYKIGDLVLVRDRKPIPNTSRGLNLKYDGPYEITKIISKQNLQVKDAKDKRFVVHYNEVKPYEHLNRKVELRQKRGVGRPAQQQPQQQQQQQQQLPQQQPQQRLEQQPQQRRQPLQLSKQPRKSNKPSTEKSSLSTPYNLRTRVNNLDSMVETDDQLIEYLDLTVQSPIN